MKIRFSLIALALSLGFAHASFADGRMISVKGEKAANLAKALAKAGVQSPKGRILSYEASDVECSAGGGIVALPMSCTLTDSRFRAELKADGELFAALSQAGVKSVRRHQGELNQLTLSVSDVYCGPGAEDETECTIEL